MKSKMPFSFLIVVYIFLSTITLAADTKPWADFYGHYMHEIFETFSNIRINMTLRQYDVAELYLGQMQESIKNAEKYIPPATKDGKKIDRKQYLDRLKKLDQNAAVLRTAMKEKKSEMVNTIAGDISNMCSSCHTQARLSQLFKDMGRRTIFETYMHEVSEHFDLAKMLMIETNNTDEVYKELESLNFYLGLLEDTAPDYGPSGVIMDRDTLIRRLKEVQEKTKSVMGEVKTKKAFDFAKYKQDLNSFCVLCHEPERIK